MTPLVATGTASYGPVQGSLSLLVPANTQSSATTTSTPRVEPDDGEDVCKFLFAHCQEWQRAFLDDAGLTCMFDVDAGSLPGAICQTLASIARNRLRRLAAVAEPPGGNVTITLRHRGPMWALAITDTAIRGATNPRFTGAEMDDLKTTAKRLDGAYVIQPVEGGTLIAVLFSDQPGVLSADAVADGRSQFRQ